MFNVSRSLDEQLVFGGKPYQLFLSFDNVLRVFDLWQDTKIQIQYKPKFALRLLTRTNDFDDTDFETQLQVYEEVFNKHIDTSKGDETGVRYDLEGNPLPVKPKKEQKGQKILFNIWYDSEYIYGFGTIRNSTALKLSSVIFSILTCFGTIRNNTALKPRRLFLVSKFRNRAIRPSQTSASNNSI